MRPPPAPTSLIALRRVSFSVFMLDSVLKHAPARRAGDHRCKARAYVFLEILRECVDLRIYMQNALGISTSPVRFVWSPALLGRRFDLVKPRGATRHPTAIRGDTEKLQCRVVFIQSP